MRKHIRGEFDMFYQLIGNNGTLLGKGYLQYGVPIFIVNADTTFMDFKSR